MQATWFDPDISSLLQFSLSLLSISYVLERKAVEILGTLKILNEASNGCSILAHSCPRWQRLSDSKATAESTVKHNTLRVLGGSFLVSALRVPGKTHDSLPPCWHVGWGWWRARFRHTTQPLLFLEFPWILHFRFFFLILVIILFAHDMTWKQLKQANTKLTVFKKVSYQFANPARAMSWMAWSFLCSL